MWEVPDGHMRLILKHAYVPHLKSVIFNGINPKLILNFRLNWSLCMECARRGKVAEISSPEICAKFQKFVIYLNLGGYIRRRYKFEEFC